jgi:N-acetylmuramoyl-L-alanine amidase CwlA
MAKPKITKKTSTKHTTYLPNKKNNWIVIHYTAGVSSKAGTAAGVANYFAHSNVDASADFVVDDATIVQYNPDPAKYYTWAVGGTKYAVQSTSEGGKYYGTCNNKNSISIEMCSSKKNTKSLKVTDKDWYITDKVIDNTIELVKYLMDKYNIDADHVIMHHHVTGKWCPQPWTYNEKALAGWKEFKKKLKSKKKEDSKIEPEENSLFMVKITVDKANIRSGPSTNDPIVDTITDKGIYTIVETKGNWGRLKSGKGWTYLKGKTERL